MSLEQMLFDLMSFDFVSGSRSSKPPVGSDPASHPGPNLIKLFSSSPMLR